MRLTKQIMGMPITIDMTDHSSDKLFDIVFNEFERIDNLYSTYKKDSEVSRYNSGELTKNDLSKEFMQIKDEINRYSSLTNGYFDAKINNNFDPSGYVKSWAIERAAKLLIKNGCKNFCISAGGDILAHGEKDWNIGLQDPRDNQKIFRMLELCNGAVATSGNYERGSHIYNPRTGELVDYWKSVTVVGAQIITADVLATACFAAGPNAMDIMKNFKNYELIALK